MALSSLNLAAATVLSLTVHAGAAQAAKNTFTCATCHPKQGFPQPATSMAHALLLPGGNSILTAHPKLSFQKAGYSYTVETRAGDSAYSVTDGINTISQPIKWAFGAGSQTWVLERDGRFYESLVSYYPNINGLDITIGDQAIKPKTLLEAFGRELPIPQITACFGCHSTHTVVADQLHLESLIPGVTCEHCHTSAMLHLESISHGKLDSVPAKLNQLSSEEISNFCGQCHRSWETIIRDRIRGEINVRFQPYRLANSKCFDGIDARISCLTCHDPHQEVVHDRASYDPKCLACHTSGPQAHTASGLTAKRCPVSSSGCVNCHMPKIDFPGGHRAFTDHDIRIVRVGESYPN